MKPLLLNLKAINIFTIFSTFAVLFFAAMTTANAQTTTFAQFLENNGSQDFVFTNNGSNGVFNTVSGGSSISFKYQNISGLNAALQGFQNAHLTVTSTTTQAGVNSAGTLTQPFNQTVTVAIIRDTAAPVGNNTRRNLLTAVFSSTINGKPAITGANNGNSATFSATTPDNVVTFSSDFISFASTTQRNAGLSFSSVTPALSLPGFLNSFSAAGTGTFASNPVPVPLIPTAASVEIGGRVLVGEKGLYGANVILTDSNGIVRYARTGFNGYYNFSGISAGQTVTVAVSSKRFSFTTQVVSVEDNISELNFSADY